MTPTSADCAQPLQGTGTQSHAVRNGLICAFVVAGCLWAAYPVVEMGFIDDSSYIKTAQIFAQTGHVVYNGCATAMLGWQVVWGALFIKLFGFSFTVVRLSILPIAMATVFLFHAILVRFGVNPRNAVLGTLTLGLSPLFMPVAASYMTDVPGLFVIVLSLYLCQRAVGASTSEATIAWLCVAAATNVIGGTARQIAWLGALVMVPSVGWLLRKRRGVLLTTSLLWVISVAIIFACMRWYARQPYSLPEAILKGPPFDPAHPAIHFFFGLVGAVLCLPLLVYPILVAWFPETRRLRRAALLRIALIIVGFGLFQRLIWAWTIPWLQASLLQYEFAATRLDVYLGTAPLILPMWVRAPISLLVIAPALILTEHVWTRLRPLKIKPAKDMLWLLGPFSLTYFVLLMPRAYHEAIFDRYLLPLMAIAIICLLKVHQEWIAPTLPAFSVVVLAVFALLAIGGTHDWFAFYRARLAAIDEIRASGVPRTAIQGGFEYDGWTEIESSGYIHDPRLQVPAGAYHPDVHSNPKFTTIFPKMGSLKPSEYPPVGYRTWLPPYHGTILVQEIPHASN
jgi:hypothetical protein